MENEHVDTSKKSKTTPLIAAAVIVVLGIAFFFFVNQYAGSQGKEYTPQAEFKPQGLTSDAIFYVTVGEKIETTSDTLSLEMAEEVCEEIAYSPDNMWKQVVCMYDGEVFYDDVFVAG